jgi:hypothetical protein
MFCEKVTNFLTDNELIVENNDDENSNAKSSITSEQEVIQVDDDKKTDRINGEASNPQTSKSSKIKFKKASDILESYVTKKDTATTTKKDEIHSADEDDDVKVVKSKNSKKISSSSSSSSDNDQDTKVVDKKAKETPPTETKNSEPHQPQILRHETPGDEKKDCFVRISYPNGDRLDFCTNGIAKFSYLIDYLTKQGYNCKRYELIERLMPQFKPSNNDLNTTSESQKISNDLSNLAINQSRNLLRFENSILTFKELNLFPRVALLLQEI